MLKEKLPLSSIKKIILGSGCERDKTEDGTAINNNYGSNIGSYFECYYCQFKTDMKSDYQRHVEQAYLNEYYYPSKIGLDRLSIGGKFR
jgi:hypothetical protein